MVPSGIELGRFESATEALRLESYGSLLALLLPFVLVVARIRVEEMTLAETLPGYGDCMRRVRYRLVPFVW